MKKIIIIPFLLIGIFVINLNANASEITEVNNSQPKSSAKTSSGSSKGFSLTDALNSTKSEKKEAKYLPTTEGQPEVAISNTIQGATNYITGVAAGVAILFIVINAGKLVFALGGSDDITKAKKGLMWALGGLVMIMFAFVIAKTIISFAFSGEV